MPQLLMVYYCIPTAADHYLEMISRLKVNHFYTSPSTIRVLRKAGEKCVKKYDLSSLKTIGSGKEVMKLYGLLTIIE